METFPDLTVKEITRLHREIFSGVIPPEDLPGRLKVRPNGIFDRAVGRMVFEATPPNETKVELVALLAWYYGPANTLDPMVSTALFFAAFQAMHPFSTGAGVWASCSTRDFCGRRVSRT